MSAQAELIRRAAQLLQSARQPGEPLPLAALIDELLAPQLQPEGLSEKDHLAAEHTRARELGTLLFSEYRRVWAAGDARWEAWENAPGGLAEKLHAYETSLAAQQNSAEQAGLAEWQLQEALEGRR